MQGPHPTSTRRTPVRGGLAALATCVVLALVATGCGGGTALPKTEGYVTAADQPVRGGKVVWGLDAETTDFCPITATLAADGMQRAYAIYDTLTRPAMDAKTGKFHYAPYLASKLTRSSDSKTWVIDIRPNVTFQDGSKLTAEVVKDNLDAYRQKSLLFQFVFSNVADVTVSGPLQVTVTTKKPWVAFDAFLYGNGRIGIMAERQLKGVDPKTGKTVVPSPDCSRTPIGTGPFQFAAVNPARLAGTTGVPGWLRSGIDKAWILYDHMDLVRNPGYWYKAPDGKPYPYLDGIQFRPFEQSTQQLYALESHVTDLSNSNSSDALRSYKTLQQSGTANYIASDQFTEVNFVQLNNSKPPFNDERVRKALQYGIDRSKINTIVTQDLNMVSDSPFAPGVVGHLDQSQSGWPPYNPVKARALIADYLHSPEGRNAYPKGQIEFTMTIIPDTGVRQIGELLQAKGLDFGIKVNLYTVDQVNLINKAIGGDYQAMVFRNYQGGDPDQMFPWFHCNGKPSGVDAVKYPNYVPDPVVNPVNFSRFCDPQIDQDLNIGRSVADPAVREKVYTDVTRQFAKRGWSIWAWYARWSIGFGPKINGVRGPDLPNGDRPYPGLATGVQVTGVWKSK